MAIIGHKGSHENQFSGVTDNDNDEYIIIHLFYPLGDYFNVHNFLTSTQGSLQSKTMWTAGLMSLNIH